MPLNVIYNEFTTYSKVSVIQFIYFIVIIWKIYHGSLTVQNYIDFDLLRSDTWKLCGKYKYI
jgi:hypothetical protein